MALKQIKDKIIATKKTGQVTKAMESVSAVKMRKSQERAFASRPYVRTALMILSRLAGSSTMLSNPLLTERTAGETLAVIVTSDKGLAGSVNSSVLKQAEKIFKENTVTDVVAIGRKAVEFSERSNKNILKSYTNVSDEVTLEDVYDLTEHITETFADLKYKNVVVLYQNFLSTFEQTPVVRQVLPVVPSEVVDVMNSIKPKAGKFSEVQSAADEETGTTPYTVEPSAEEVLDALLPQLVQVLFYHALLESKASEHSARMVAMKNATDKSKELVKSMTITFNKKRQAAITAEVSEITAGVEAMK